MAAPADDIEHVSGLLDACRPFAEVTVVAGGQTRSASVLRALETLPQEADVVLVHDAARALTPVALVESVDAAVRSAHPAVIPVLPVVDTIKSVEVPPQGGLPRVTSTVDRASLRAVQTPQGFRRDVLDEAYRAAAAAGRLDATDDAGLVEALGYPVAVIPGDERAFKVTRPLDLVLADAMLTAKAAELTATHDHGGPR